MWGAIALIWRPAFFKSAPVIPDGLKGRSGIQGPAAQPLKRLTRGAMDSGFAPRARPGMTLVAVHSNSSWPAVYGLPEGVRYLSTQCGFAGRIPSCGCISRPSINVLMRWILGFSSPVYGGGVDPGLNPGETEGVAVCADTPFGPSGHFPRKRGKKARQNLSVHCAQEVFPKPILAHSRESGNPAAVRFPEVWIPRKRGDVPA